MAEIFRDKFSTVLLNLKIIVCSVYFIIINNSEGALSKYTIKYVESQLTP
jgi:hypothetical protein